MAHSSQTRIVGKVDGQCLHALWWLERPFLHVHPYRILDRRRFRMRMVGMLLALSAACVFPLWLYASLPQTQLAFLADERQLSQSEASCCRD